ncbi:hypothetical protein V6Z12_A09G036800 [Gossypium hirsutum]
MRVTTQNKPDCLNELYCPYTNLGTKCQAYRLHVLKKTHLNLRGDKLSNPQQMLVLVQLVNFSYSYITSHIDPTQRANNPIGMSIVSYPIFHPDTIYTSISFVTIYSIPHILYFQPQFTI